MVNGHNSLPGRPGRGRGLLKNCTVTVLLIALLLTMIPAVPVEAKATISLNKKSASLYVGQTLTLKAVRKGTSKTVKWSSSKSTVATVSSAGKVKAKKAGTTTITAKAGSVKATCKITVKNPSIKLNRASTSVTVKGTFQLKATVYGASKKVTWSSSNTAKATVSSTGKVTGKAVGTVTITAKANGKKASCKVTVKKPAVPAFNPTRVTGVVWSLSEGGPTLSIRIHNGSSKTIYVNRYLKICNCKRFYTSRYEYENHAESLTAEGWYDDKPPVTIKPGETKMIEYSAPGSRYWDTYFTKSSFAYLYIGLGKDEYKVYDYLYVIDIGEDSHVLKYATTYAKSDNYIYNRESGGSGSTYTTPVATGSKRTCPFCRGTGKCSHCSGSGKQSVKTSLYGDKCVTCMGSGKCQCCNGKGVY